MGVEIVTADELLVSVQGCQGWCQKEFPGMYSSAFLKFVSWVILGSKWKFLNNLIITFYMNKIITRISNPAFHRYHITVSDFFFFLI